MSNPIADFANGMQAGIGSTASLMNMGKGKGQATDIKKPEQDEGQDFLSQSWGTLSGIVKDMANSEPLKYTPAGGIIQAGLDKSIAGNLLSGGIGNTIGGKLLGGLGSGGLLGGLLK